MAAETSIEDVGGNVRRLAAALGETERGEALIADFRHRRAAVAPPTAPVRLALEWEPGLPSGPGTPAHADWKRVLAGTSGSVRVELGGSGVLDKKHTSRR